MQLLPTAAVATASAPSEQRRGWVMQTTTTTSSHRIGAYITQTMAESKTKQTAININVCGELQRGAEDAAAAATETAETGGPTCARFISDKLQLHLQRNLCEPPLYTEPNPEASNQAACCVAILSFNPVSCSAFGDCGDLLINNLFSFLLHLGKDSLAIAAQECHTPTILEQPLLEPRDPVALACPAPSSHLHMRHADEARFDPRPPVETSTSTSTATATATQRRSAHACCVFGFRFLLSVLLLLPALLPSRALAWPGLAPAQALA